MIVKNNTNSNNYNNTPATGSVRRRIAVISNINTYGLGRGTRVAENVSETPVTIVISEKIQNSNYSLCGSEFNVPADFFARRRIYKTRTSEDNRRVEATYRSRENNIVSIVAENVAIPTPNVFI